MARKRRKKRRISSLRDLDFDRPNLDLSHETKRGVIIVILIAFGIVSILSLLDLAGTLGVYVNGGLKTLFGINRWYLPVVILLIGYFLMRPIKYGFKLSNFIGVTLLMLGLSAFIHIIFHQNDLIGAAKQGFGGGYSGIILAWPLLKYTGFWVSLVVTISIAIIGFLLLFERLIVNIFEKRRGQEEDEEVLDDEEKLSPVQRLKRIFIKESNEEEDYSEDEEDEVEEEPVFSQKEVEDEEIKDEEESETDTFNSGVGKFKNIKVDLPLSLLDGKTSTPKGGDIKANKEIIKQTLENFGVPAEMGEARVGPTVTQYTFKPAEGVRLSKITNLGDNLALALAAHPIRIEAPIPGKSLVGIEVPNEAKAIVPLKEILNSEQFANRKSNLAVALGKDVTGKPWLVGLDQMPHLLVAGATGSGKSVSINSVILSLLFQNGPGELKFIMVDPKRVELPIYNGIPHLLTPVITDVKKTINSLRWAIKEMEKRFDILSSSHHRNIASYNAKKEDKMPYIVIVIDELADLMSAAGPEVEAAIVRLAQMSRAVGIHLILATQRPSVDVITGLIKANITTRIAFSVASLVDSRTILDMSGAEKLLGRGDMLYISAEVSKPKRLQGAYASDEEIKRIIAHLKKQAEPDYIEEVVEKPTSPSGIGTGGYNAEASDPLIEEAIDVIFKAKKASASLLQRRLRVGYARAARILDLLEAQGMIGPADGAKPREILIASLDDAKIDSTPAAGYKEEELEENEEEIKEVGNYFKEGEEAEEDVDPSVPTELKEEEEEIEKKGDYLEEDEEVVEKSDYLEEEDDETKN